MKLTNAQYATKEERDIIFKELNIRLSILHYCSCVVIKKHDANLILKDRWLDPYKSAEENIKTFCDKDFLIISKQLLTRINKHYEKIIFPGDNLLIIF